MLVLLLLLAATAGTGQAVPVPSPVDQLQHADDVKTSDHAAFDAILAAVARDPSALPGKERARLRFLKVWDRVYHGDYAAAGPMLDAIIDGPGDPTNRFRAAATSINILGVGHRYEEAFQRLNLLLELLPQVSDKRARYQGLGEAAQLLISAGQYELASRYADIMLADLPRGENSCKALFFKLHAAYREGSLKADNPLLQSGIDACVAMHESIFADSMRADAASLAIAREDFRAAAGLLQRHYQEVLDDGFPNLVSQYQALLAQSWWRMHDAARARHYALSALSSSIAGEYTEPLGAAYKVLYEIERAQGRAASALAYHEKYMAADKAYLDDVGARALAYQVVRQQVQAKKAEVDALARKNQILQLQRALDRKAVEASRLYVIVLAMGLLVIGLWLLRLKRSQLRFMRMAQRDSLTGIYNRKHFVNEAEFALRYAQRSARGACMVLIDLDHFKLINDTYGHATGDQVLRRAVSACQDFVRSTDVFGRLGGEEFGVLLPECGLDAGIERAEAIRRAIAALSEQADPGVPVSASFGVAFTGESGYQLVDLLKDADQALYRAKRAGRNCVVAGKQGEGVVIA